MGAMEPLAELLLRGEKMATMLYLEDRETEYADNKIFYEPWQESVRALGGDADNAIREILEEYPEMFQWYELT